MNTKFAVLSILCFGILAMIPVDARSQNTYGSDRLVTQAEDLIRQAGQSHPPDTQKIHRAIDMLQDAVRENPRNDGAFVDLGFCYGVLHDGATAVDMYMKAAHLNPSAANFKELADIYMRVGDPEHALMAANAGISKDPRNAALYNAKGMALNDLERFDEAASAFQKAIDIDPNFTIARANLKALNTGPKGRGSISKQER